MFYFCDTLLFMTMHACVLFSTLLRHKQGPHELAKWMDKARVTRALDYP
jgi:hypothetical protein